MTIHDMPKDMRLAKRNYGLMMRIYGVFFYDESTPIGETRTDLVETIQRE